LEHCVPPVRRADIAPARRRPENPMPPRSPDGRPPDDGSAVSLSVRGLSARIAQRTILQDINLSLPRGQRLGLLGPPGAGQTALLLAIAGLLKTEQGSVLADGHDITRLRPAARGIGVALLAPPRGPLAARRMRQLAPAPSQGLLLLERPDAWPPSGSTVVASFADQALALSGDGRLVQEGPAAAVYENPRTVFVARFLGAANIIAGTVREIRPGGFALVAGGQRLQLLSAPDAPRTALGTKVTLALRPERIALLFGEEAADNTAAGVVATSVFQGASVLLGVETPLGRLDARLPGWRAAQMPAPGSTVRLGWAADAAIPVSDD
jgi:ABC-type Fe3+/spermidine/putrescine transport system ATPase subunit